MICSLKKTAKYTSELSMWNMLTLARPRMKYNILQDLVRWEYLQKRFLNIQNVVTIQVNFRWRRQFTKLMTRHFQTVLVLSDLVNPNSIIFNDRYICKAFVSSLLYCFKNCSQCPIFQVIFWLMFYIYC